MVKGLGCRPVVGVWARSKRPASESPPGRDPRGPGGPLAVWGFDGSAAWVRDAATAAIGGRSTAVVAMLTPGRWSRGRFWPDRRCGACLRRRRATAMRRRKRGSPAGGMRGEAVTGVMTSQCRCSIGVTAEREGRHRARGEDIAAPELAVREPGRAAHPRMAQLKTPVPKIRTAPEGAASLSEVSVFFTLGCADAAPGQARAARCRAARARPARGCSAAVG
jgi:hypothetical protein